jgi:hypothetical protein
MNNTFSRIYKLKKHKVRIKTDGNMKGSYQIAQTKLLFIGKVIITQSNGGTNDFALTYHDLCVRSVMYSSLIIFWVFYNKKNILK